MKRIAIPLIALGLLTGIAVAVPSREDKVTLCHRTDSVTNPYVKITVDASAVDGEGNNDHSHHTGPIATSETVAQTLKDNKEKWGDIIPNILNWTTDGQAIFNNDCKFVVVVEPTPPPGQTPPPTVTPPTVTSNLEAPKVSGLPTVGGHGTSRP